MKRILLFLEDLNEQNFIEVLLKKISFDVLAIRKESKLNDSVMSFRPDVIIATGEGSKVDGTVVAKEMKAKGVYSKLILCFSINQFMDKKITSKYKFDKAIETPVNPKQLIITLCDLTGLDQDMVLKKYEKLPISQSTKDPSSNLQIISSKGKTKSERAKKYDEILKNAPQSKENGFARKQVSEEEKKMQEFEKDHPDIKEIDEARKNFVISLFKK